MDDHKALNLHKQLQGKISTEIKTELTKDTLPLLYSPGVAEAAQYARDDQDRLREVSWTRNLVAVISDGSAVLGLGNIGPEGALPVMEGKAMILKQFAGIDAVPIVLNVHTEDEIVAAISAIAPSFGAINLEDIAAPICFGVEERLKNELTIPIMHDDQHGTAVVVLAALINAVKVVGKDLSECKVVLAGAGAAGVGIARILHTYAHPEVVVVDSKGILHDGRTDLNKEKVMLMSYSSAQEPGDLKKALHGADIFIGVSRGDTLQKDDLTVMAEDPIIFALANPRPEIMPEDALSAGAAVVATGRSDYPNQVNNSLGFPGIFRGALDHTVSKITDAHKIAAAEALANLVDNPTADKIIPGPFDEGIVQAVSAVIK